MRKLIAYLQRYYVILHADPKKIIWTYHQLLYQLNEWHSYMVDQEVIERKIIGVDEFGRLLLVDKNNNTSRFDLKQIKFL